MVTLKARLWDYGGLCHDLGISPADPPPARPVFIDRVDVDAEYCRPNSLFVPRMPHRDEIEPPDQPVEVPAALERGASLALTDLPPGSFAAQAPVIYVPDRHAALLRLARAGRDRFTGRMIAITGSVGKTTTKALLHHVLAHVGPAEMSRGNYNGINGVAITLASLSPAARYCVTEISSAFPGSLPSKLPHLEPDVALLTTIGHSHLGNFPDRAAILRDKFHLIEALQGDGIAIFGEDVIALDRQHDNLIAGRDLSWMSVGRASWCDVQLLEAETSLDDVRAVVRVGGRRHAVYLPVPGQAHAVAACHVLACVHALGLDVAQAVDCLAGYAAPGNQRGARWRVNVGNRGAIVEVIDDSQNAAPESVAELMSYLALRRNGRKVLVMADMLELGDHSAALHGDLLPGLIEAGVDELVAVGPFTGQLADRLQGRIAVSKHDTPLMAARHLFATLKGGELVALKGSGDWELREVLRRLSPAAHRTRAGRNWRIEHDAPT